jgi:small subunit ribosomal protein S1
MSELHEDFNWSSYKSGYTGGNKLIPNKDIIGSNTKNKCFSREPYAQKMFELYEGIDSKIIRKDLNKGDCVPVIDILNVRENSMDIELAGGMTVTIDLNREKRFIQAFGSNDIIDFTSKMVTREQIDHLLKHNLMAYITESYPMLKISMWQGYLFGVREEFMKEISNPTKAYTAKILNANKGGFFVEVQGIEAFMPGSLAAANKINDFQSYIGKEVIVMVEDFLKDMNSFIVSHKKYIEHILPQKLDSLDFSKPIQGKVTGTSKYGIFIEFEEILTGLLHVSKMKEDTKKLFDGGFYRPGSDIQAYVSEVTKDRRVILTEENPSEKLERVQKFIIENTGKIVESEVAAIMNFGVIVTIGDIAGLIPLREFKRSKVFLNNFVVKDKINVIFSEYKDDKLVFNLPNQHK